MAWEDYNNTVGLGTHSSSTAATSTILSVPTRPPFLVVVLVRVAVARPAATSIVFVVVVDCAACVGVPWNSSRAPPCVVCTAVAVVAVLIPPRGTD